MDVLDQLPAADALSPEAREALAAYLALLTRRRLANVTGLRDRDEVARTLLGDALALTVLPEVAAAVGGTGRWLDLGSGAGVPGIPLALAVPNVTMVLLESVGKKCAFLRQAVTTTGLSDRVRVVCERSEHYAAGPPGREAHELVFARAVGPLATVVELAAPLVAPEGHLVVSTSESRAQDQRGDAAATVAACGMVLQRIEGLSESPLDHSVAVVVQRVGAVPDRVPRRPGLARRRPLRR
jgi:16S rRNA (guanine527-N7)-methyltransferase